jgi:uncharacterized protein YggU (UPF0235/DUF167 family)
VTRFRAAIRVSPGARQDAVGGARPPSRAGEGQVLVVRVRARPVDGAATLAAERALAAALGLPAHRVRVVRGATSREKLVEVVDPPEDLGDRWAALLSR